ncbi:hypothetical protein A5658_26240 [Mycobacterium sp. 1245111.1]|uniref:hypothetical protein n=1 Tax=Mycobacterium sp. 1245111.1 TaxID=1834073 RepID=UPI0007FDCA8D|nr:hypothetical protein [Mycobacterium sp. 1245111.1]OBK38331.1 hypothetical protein A5658_26240 [Mycobacterium sp. 1245111.1]
MTTRTLRPARGIAAIAGAAAAGIALGQLSLAPAARADDAVADIAADLALLFDSGSSDLTAGATDLAYGDFATGLGLTFFGTDDYLVSSGQVLTVDIADALTGHLTDASYDLMWPDVESFTPPTDLAATFSDLQDIATVASQDFAQSATYFADGELAEGLLFGFSGFDNLVVGSPEILAVGLAEALVTGL